MVNLKSNDLNIWMMENLGYSFEEEAQKMSSDYDTNNLEDQFYLELILSKFSDYPQLTFWDKNVAHQVYTMMMNLCGDDFNIVDLTKGFHYFVLSIEELFSSANALSLVQKYDGPQEIKIMTLLLPGIAQLLNGPFTNLLKFFMHSLQIWLDANNIDKNVLLQNKNTSMMEILNKYYDTKIFSNIINGDIRNALSHGGYRVVNDGRYITFYYSKNHTSCSLNVTGTVLNDDSYRTLDVISGAIIGVMQYLVHLGRTEELFKNDSPIVSDFKSRLMLSTNHLNCVFAGRDPEFNDLVEVRVESKENVSQNIISTWAVNFLAKARIMFPGYRRYMFNFKRPNAINSWGQILGTTLDRYLSDKLDAQGVLTEVVSDSDDYEMFVQFPEYANSESGVRLLFNPYKSIKLDGIVIDYIEDMSVDSSAKRFKCRAFVNCENVRDTKVVSNKIIKRIENLPNYSKPEYETKHGEMKADVILIDFFRKNRATRHDSAFVLSSNNENYIGSCEYYREGFLDKTTKIFDTLDWQNLRKQNSDANKLWLWNKNVPRK